MFLSFILICNNSIFRTFSKYIVRINRCFIFSFSQIDEMCDRSYGICIIYDSVFALNYACIIADIIILITNLNRITISDVLVILLQKQCEGLIAANCIIIGMISPIE